ncbi:MAG: hypothetical protein ACYC56_09930, partial [Candidatus Aquicultor sp.]
MRPYRRMGIRTKLIIIYLLIAIPLITLLGVSFYGRYRADQNAALTERMEIARLAASNFNLFIDQIVETELDVGDTIVDQKLSVVDANKLLSRIAGSKHASGIIISHPSPISNVAFMDKNGMVTAASLTKTIGQNRANHPEVKAVLRGADSAIGNLQRDIDGSLGFIIAVGIRRGGSLVGIVSTSIKADELGNILDIAVARGGVNIVDAGGHLVFQSEAPSVPFAKRNWSNQPFVKAALKGKTFISTGIMFPFDRHFRMGVEIPISSIGWATGSFVP